MTCTYRFYISPRICANFNPATVQLCTGAFVTPNDDIAINPPRFKSCTVV